MWSLYHCVSRVEPLEDVSLSFEAILDASGNSKPKKRKKVEPFRELPPGSFDNLNVEVSLNLDGESWILIYLDFIWFMKVFSFVKVHESLFSFQLVNVWYDYHTFLPKVSIKVRFCIMKMKWFRNATKNAILWALNDFGYIK